MTTSIAPRQLLRLACALVCTAATAGAGVTLLDAQSMTSVPSAQKLDIDYTAKIKAATADPRILTELVDHMPASDKVPSPLKFLGYIPGEPGKLTYHRDIVRYLDALDKASDRVAMFKIGESDEGRDMVAVAVADEATIKQLDKYRQITAQLTDPRKLTEAQARQLIATGKPIYFAMGSIHSPELGSPEMLMELAYRLAIEESPFIQTIRNNIIFVFTPATEVDGREKQVDNFVAQQKGLPGPSMVYWGKYVQHDNNRDGIGVGLRLTQVMLKTFLDWHPQVWHDLHESVTLLYTSTGTGPYNAIVDPIQINEWWLLAQTEIMELTKRGVPGVWTYNYYDGWVPNYMFWIGVTHNSIGRFYETQSYGGAVNRPLTVQQSREWYRPNPTPLRHALGSAQQRQHAAERAPDRDEHRWPGTRRRSSRTTTSRTSTRSSAGVTKAPYAYVVPAKQRRRVEAAELMNLVRREGAEVHTATAAFGIGTTQVEAGDYIVRLDQPFGGIVESLLGVQFYAPENPRPYDDTGWAIPLVRNLKTRRIDDKAIFDKPMTLAPADFRIPGTITGTRPRPSRRSHDRQPARHVPLHARRREDVGGGARVRGRRPPFRAGRVRDRGRWRKPRRGRTLDPRARPVGVGRGRRAERADARPRRAADRLRAHLDQHAGRRLGAAGVRQFQGAVRLLRRAETPATATCARSTTSSSSRMPGRAGPRSSRAASRAASRGPTRRPS